VQGIGDLLSTYARCCKPVPPEPIVGYITGGPGGVSIHAQSCANLAPPQQSKSPARVLAVAWGKMGSNRIPRGKSMSRHSTAAELVRDVSAALGGRQDQHPGHEHGSPTNATTSRICGFENIDHGACRQLSQVAGAYCAAPQRPSSARRNKKMNLPTSVPRESNGRFETFQNHGGK